MKGKADFTHGVNFAVGGSTALSADTLAEKNIIVSGTKSSLSIQLEWMSAYFDSHCNADLGWYSRLQKNQIYSELAFLYILLKIGAHISQTADVEV